MAPLLVSNGHNVTTVCHVLEESEGEPEVLRNYSLFGATASVETQSTLEEFNPACRCVGQPCQQITRLEDSLDKKSKT